MTLAIITSAPTDRPQYFSDLLEAIALPVGMTAQFTYRFHWFSGSAFERLKNVPASGENGILFFADSSTGLSLYPVRHLRNIRAYYRYWSKLDSSRLKNKPLKEDNPVLEVRFQVGRLFDYGSDEDAVISRWTEAIQRDLSVRGDGLAGSFIQELCECAPEDIDNCHNTAERWATLSTALSRSELSRHILAHVEGVFERPVARSNPTAVSPNGDNRTPGYRLDSAKSYELRIHSLIPSSDVADLALKVRSDTTAVSIAYPRYRVTGQRREDTVFLQVQRLHERIVGAIQVEVASSTVKDGSGSAPAGEVASKCAPFPKVSFAVECAYKKRRLFGAIAVIWFGIVFANLNADALHATLQLSEGYCEAIVAVSKGVGLAIAAVVAFFTFRKVPG